MPTDVTPAVRSLLAWTATCLGVMVFAFSPAGCDGSSAGGQGADTGVGGSASGGSSMTQGTGGNAGSGSGGTVPVAGRSGADGNVAGGAAGTTAPVQGGSAGQSVTGGRTGTGGQSPGDAGTGSGGGTGTGGTAAAGGTSSVGGSHASGGSAGAGGAGSGGSGAAGGSTTSRTGGSSTTGGTTSTGGVATGGSTGALIRNDTFWKDTAGNFIYSQGGGVLQVGDTYYWYGVKYGGAVTYAANPDGKNGDISFAGVTTYSSKDLASWKLETVSKVANAGGWFGRIGVVYNSGTKKYVLVGQGGAGEYWATADSPAGPFVYDHSQGTLDGIANGGTGDQTTFQDDDGKGYVICSSKEGRSNLYVVPLRESDFLALGTPTRIMNGVGREGNAMFKYNGTYYFCSSDLHGWNTSQTYCISSTKILGPYGAEFVMANTEKDYSHVTQTGFFITVKGTQGSFVIFAGDRWSDFAGNGIGFNQWMPVTFEGTKPIFHSLSEWSIDAAAGTWSVGPNNNYVLNPSFEADRISVTTPVGWTAKSGSNTQSPHGPGRWSWQVSSGGSIDQKVVNLPNGTYTLSVWAKGGSGATLYAKGFGGTDMSASLGSGSSWAKVSLPGITVSNGTCQVGVSGAASVDDFVLVKN